MENANAKAHRPHVVSAQFLIGVGVALMVLTAATVAVTWVDLGSMNLAVAILIAVVKATLVAFFFMHLWWDAKLNAVLLLVAIGFVLLFILLATMDTLQYAPLRIPDHAPTVNQ